MNNQIQPRLYPINRRNLLWFSGMSLVFFGGIGSLLSSCLSPQTGIMPSQPATQSTTTFTPDLEMSLTATEATIQILPGPSTKVFSYQGKVLKGDPEAVVAVPNSYVGPIIRTRIGQKVRIHFKNNLTEASNIHWHGLIMPPAMDGHPGDLVTANSEYMYEFEVRNRAGTYWFHPHPHEHTAEQVYQGLAGLFIVSDEEEGKLALPTGDYDVPLVIQDRTFDADNQFVYFPSQTPTLAAREGMEHEDEAMHQTMGFLGDRILVNGRPDVVLPVTTRIYRLRLLNGSNSRIYKLAWSNGVPLTVIATDGGLLDQPVQRPYVTLAPGERVDLWADFSQLAVGDEVYLQSLAYTGVEAGMFMDGVRMDMEETVVLPNGEPFTVLTVHVEGIEAEPLMLPTQLARIERLGVENAVNATQPRPFSLSMAGGQWLINSRPFVMHEVNDNEKVALGSIEVWEFINELNTTGMVLGSQSHLGHMQSGHMSETSMQGEAIDFMAHPMHIHGVQFQVLSRQIDSAYEQDWRTLSEGFVDEGWKDTVLVMPGERVRIVVRFADYQGRYLVHCHNLEHEDMGMMLNYVVT